jgi:SAM-dependent methyltransferase
MTRRSEGSVAFDRAAEFYDETRGYDEGLARATTELLVAELDGRGSVLEVGVGTGLIALPLHGSGIPMLGLDISAPMVGKLVEKAGGGPPFPLVLGDATALPFADDAVDAGLIRWVLHLIPDWPGAVAELARVVRPRGVLVVHLGTYGGPRDEIHRRFEEVVGYSVDPVGLGWHAEAELDAEVARHDGRLRMLPALTHRSEEPLAAFLDGIEHSRYSWTWPVPDDVRLAALGEVRPWAEERFGPLDRPLTWESTIVWRAYDLP